MDEMDMDMLCKALLDCEVFVFRARRNDASYPETHTPLQVYNEWVSERGIALYDDESVLYLISHIEDILKMSLLDLGSYLVRDGGIRKEDVYALIEEE